MPSNDQNAAIPTQRRNAATPQTLARDEWRRVSRCAQVAAVAGPVLLGEESEAVSAHRLVSMEETGMSVAAECRR